VLTRTDPLGNVTTNKYDVFGNLSAETMPNGSVYVYTYDKLNRLLTKSFKESSGSTAVLLESIAYAVMTDNTTRVTTTVYYSTSSTAVTVSTYDFAGRLIKTINPDGGEITSTYLPTGHIQSVTDAMGGVKYYEYNARGLITKLWYPVTNVSHSLTTYEYDNAGRLTKEESYVNVFTKGATPTGAKVTTDYTYYIDSKVKDVKTNNSALTSYTYDNEGNIASIVTLVSAGRTSKVEYTYNYLHKVATAREYQEEMDIDGRPDTTQLFGIVTSYAYDLNGNLTKVTYANGEVVNYEYDLLDRQIKETRDAFDESLEIQPVSRTVAYDNMGNVITETNEKGYITSYNYTARGFLASVVDSTNAVTAMEYDWQGRLVKKYSPRALLKDEPGNIVVPVSGKWPSPVSQTAVNYTGYVYDSMGRLLSRTEYYRDTFTSSVRSVIVETNTYDKNGNVLTSKDALNNTTTYTYDKGNRLTKLKDALNNETNYSYNAFGRLVSTLDARGVTTYNTYDLFGNVIQESIAGQIVLTAEYDYRGNIISQTDANGNTTNFAYTLGGQLRSATSPSSYSIRYQYNEMGYCTRTSDSMNKVVINAYDGWGRLLIAKQQNANGSNAITIITLYDVLGNPVFVADELGEITQYTYDSLSRVVAVKNPLGQISTVSYDADGNKTASTDWLGNKTTYSYDILGRLINVTDPGGIKQETLTYTDTNLQNTSTDALNNVTTFTYDKLGRLLSTTDPEGYSTSQSYDLVGNVVSSTDGKGSVTSYTYDNWNRLVCVSDASGVDTVFAYDAVGNLLTQTDGNGNTTNYVYNNLNLPLSRIDGAGLEESYAYSIDGKLMSKLDRNGIISSYAYDVHGRMISEVVGGETSSYIYDNAGNLLSVEDSSGAIVRTYDAGGRVVSKTVPEFGTTTFVYDITAGLPSGYIGESTTINGHTVLRVFDKNGRLVEVRDGGDVTSYEYYANGGLKTQTLPNGITANYTYYKNSLLHTLQNKQGSSILEAYQYAYDGAGYMTAKQDIKGRTEYTYTALGQLLTVLEPSGRLTEYTYDAAGNRETETVTEDDDVSVTTYDVNEQNRLMQTVKETEDKTVIEEYFYDAAGNMLGRRPEAFVDGTPSVGLAKFGLGWLDKDDLTPATYSYNSKNQMIEAQTGKSKVESSFNAEGRRVSKTVNEITLNYCYEYDRIIMELANNGSETYNVYGVNLISRNIDGGKVYYIYNGHGDVTGLTDSGGNVIASYYYDAFGVILEETGDYSNPFRYSGYYYDEETDIYDLKARFYDAKISRFMQEDTYRGNQKDPLSLNLYTYCHNNPIKYYDPTGHVLSEADTKNLSPAQQDAILKATNDWNKAAAAGDQAGMSAAHAAAEAIRKSAGYSGGTDGSGYIPTNSSGNNSNNGGSDSTGNNNNYYYYDSSSGGSSNGSTVIQTTIINPDPSVGIGYIIDGKTYKDPYGNTRIDPGTIVYTGGGLFRYLGNGQSILYAASHDDINAVLFRHIEGYEIGDSSTAPPTQSIPWSPPGSSNSDSSQNKAKETKIILPGDTTYSTGYIIDGKTYLDKAGTKPVPKHTIVETGGGIFQRQSDVSVSNSSVSFEDLILIAGGVALLDSPALGPADLLALGIVIVGGIIMFIVDMLAPPSTPSDPTRGIGGSGTANPPPDPDDDGTKRNWETVNEKRLENALEEQGTDPHQLKQDYLGKSASVQKYDIVVDKYSGQLGIIEKATGVLVAITDYFIK
jgi:RHS repeat-associated protein